MLAQAGLLSMLHCSTLQGSAVSIMLLPAMWTFDARCVQAELLIVHGGCMCCAGMQWRLPVTP
jgi:hypothetical protein